MLAHVFVLKLKILTAEASWYHLVSTTNWAFT